MASRSLNKVMLIGNLGADPEVRMTPSGVQVATLSLATTYSWKDPNGSVHDKTEWHRVVLWRGLADVAQKYLKKGNSVYIEGRLQTRSWDDSSGQKRYTTEIVGDQMIMLGSGGAQSGGGSSIPHPGDQDFTGHTSAPEGMPSSPGKTFTPNQPEPPMYEDGEDDLPF